ncbi:MAG: ATP-binding cassette domain-containing protein [Streptosporangiales bacterium]|nr:ATP-binding cassette domain-containing protein [Streptosporangiales bacterium]
MGTPKLALEDVSVVLGSKLILRDISLEVGEHEFVCVIGASGGGKTTLLRTVGGLIPAESGAVLLDGAPLPGPNPRLAMVFQHFSLFPWKSVRANVAYGLRVQGRRDDAGAVDRLLGVMRLTEVADHFPHQLSGGMRQRVGIARALAVDPEVLLLDEPFSAVDAITREQLQAEVLALWERDAARSAVLVTHDIDEAILMADRVVVLSGPPGRITLEVPVPIPRPRSPYALRSHEDYPELRARLWEAVRAGLEGAA